MAFWKTIDARSSDDYDVIVVGSGVSSLTCAALFGRFGKKVAVLEQHEVAGGSIHSFKQGTEWVNAGWHCVGRIRGVFRPIWDDITGNAQFTITNEDCPHDTMIGVGGLSKSNFKEKMGMGIGPFMELAKCFHLIMTVKMLPGIIAYFLWLFKFVLTGKRREAQMSFSEFCRKHTIKQPYTEKEDNPVWWIHQGIHGMAQEKTCAIVGAGPIAHFYGGLVEVEGGPMRVVERICQTIQRRGGCVLVKADVQEVVVEKGAVRGVKMHDGTVLNAPCVVVTGAHLLTQLVKKPPREIVDAVKTCGPSIIFGGIFLTFEGRKHDDVGLPPNVTWFVHPAIPAPNNICFLSYLESPSGVVINYFFPMPYVKRGANYEQIKEETTARELKVLIEKFPGLKNYSTMDSCTPTTFEKYLRSWAGGCYGLAQALERYTDYNVVRALRPKTSIPGLFLTGQDVFTCGVQPAMMAALMTVQTYLYGEWGPFLFGKSILKDLQKPAP